MCLAVRKAQVAAKRDAQLVTTATHADGQCDTINTRLYKSCLACQNIVRLSYNSSFAAFQSRPDWMMYPSLPVSD